MSLFALSVMEIGPLHRPVIHVWYPVYECIILKPSKNEETTWARRSACADLVIYIKHTDHKSGTMIQIMVQNMDTNSSATQNKDKKMVQYKHKDKK